MEEGVKKINHMNRQIDEWVDRESKFILMDSKCIFNFSTGTFFIVLYLELQSQTSDIWQTFLIILSMYILDPYS